MGYYPPFACLGIRLGVKAQKNLVKVVDLPGRGGEEQVIFTAGQDFVPACRVIGVSSLNSARCAACARGPLLL